MLAPAIFVALCASKSSPLSTREHRSHRSGAWARFAGGGEATGTSAYTLISTELLAQLMDCEQSPCATPTLPALRNRYFGLRHGQSEANVEGIISSDPAVGTVKHGLTVEGRLQARRAATRLVDLVGRDQLHKLHFYSSDFTRAWQTADETLSATRNLISFESAVDSSKAAPLAARVVQTPLLRERWFGSLDGTELRNYQQVWPRDLISAEHSYGGVESVGAVSRRVRDLILQLEQAHDGCSIVLVSHADTLQIMQVYMAGADARTFSQYRFVNGEVRALRQERSSLSEPVPLTYV